MRLLQLNQLIEIFSRMYTIAHRSTVTTTEVFLDNVNQNEIAHSIGYTLLSCPPFRHQTIFVNVHYMVKKVVCLHIDCDIRSVARKSEDAVDLQSDLDTTEHHIRDRATHYPCVLDWSLRW